MKQALHWSVILLLCLSLSSPVFGLSGWPNGGTIVTGSAVEFDREAWEANLARPNATGNISVTAFDLSTEWPGVKKENNWLLAINVTSDIPDTQTMNPSNATGKTFTGTSIFLQAPEEQRGLFSSNNKTALDETTWKICVVVVPDVSQKNDDDDGTCGSVMSSQCIADLEKAYAEKFARNQDCYGTPPPTPPSCGSSVNTGGFNVQQLPLDSITGKEVFVTASTSHDPGEDNDRTFNDAINKTWPVLTIWGWNARADVPDGTMPTVQLSCISAKDVVPGSREPTPSAAAASGTVGSVLVLAAFFVTWGLVLG